MARLLQLETFDLPEAGANGPDVSPAAAEEQRLATYEQGYSAGWDDAIAAQSTEVTRVRSDLGRNLAEMTLSYRDARRHVLAAIEPLFREMVAKVLPAIARQSLGAIILDELLPAANALATAPILVRTAPDNRDLVAGLLADATDLPLTVIADDTLEAGQAYLKLAESEICIDLTRVVGAITTAVDNFFVQQKEGN